MEKKVKQLRICHGPVNIGGVGGYLAESQRACDCVADFIVWIDATTRQNYHLNLHVELYWSRFLKSGVVFSSFLLVSFKYNVCQFYYGRTLLPFSLDLPILRLFNKKILMMYCGSGVRLIRDVEQKRNPSWKLLELKKDDPKFDRRKK